VLGAKTKLGVVMARQVSMLSFHAKAEMLSPLIQFINSQKMPSKIAFLKRMIKLLSKREKIEMSLFGTLSPQLRNLAKSVWQQ